MNWLAPEFQLFERDASWRKWSIGVAVVAILLAIWQMNILFGIFILLAEGLLLFGGQDKPQMRSYGITEEGILVGENDLHVYENLAGFSLFDDPLAPGYHELVLRKNGTVNSMVKILVPDEFVEDVRDILLDHLHELAYEESLIDHMSKRLKL